MKLRGLNQSQLARAANISASMVNKLTSGTARETAHIYALAKALDCSPEYLAGDVDAIDVGKASEKRQHFNSFPVEVDGNRHVEELPADVVEIRELDLTFGFGATYLDVPVTETMRPFGREFIRQHTRAKPEELFFAQGIGDSMFPTLLDSDVLLIDTSQKVVNIAAKVWAVAYGGMGMVKRISPAKGGGVMLHSDNAAIPDQVAYDGELQVLGRVVAFFRKM